MNYDYSYEYGNIYDPGSINNVSEAIAAVFLAIYLIVLTVILIFALVSYIFHSVGLYTIGKRMGKQYPWLAFIPFARDYFQGELAGEITLKNKKIKNPGIWNLVLPIAGSVLSGIFMVFVLLVGSIGMIVGGAGGVGVMLTLILLMYIFSIILLIAVNVVRCVLLVLIDKQIFERFTTDNMSLVHSVASRFVPLYEAFCFFVMRDKEFREGKEPELTWPPAPGAPEYPQEPSTETAVPAHPEEASAEFAPTDSTTEAGKTE